MKRVVVTTIISLISLTATAQIKPSEQEMRNYVQKCFSSGAVAVQATLSGMTVEKLCSWKGAAYAMGGDPEEIADAFIRMQRDLQCAMPPRMRSSQFANQCR